MSVASGPAKDLKLVVPSRLFGPLEVAPSSCIRFPDGILGFAGDRTFAVLAAEREGLYWLQDTRDSAVVFLAADPFVFVPGFTLDLASADLPFDTSPNVSVLALVTLPPQRGAAATVNLQGPIVLDFATRLGAQLVLDGTRYPTKQAITL